VTAGVCAIGLLLAGQVSSAARIEHVFHISVDGLRPDSITTLGSGQVPNFYKLRTQGAYTDNARADLFTTETLPNHATELTGRGVKNPAGNTGPSYSGHDWTGNGNPGSATLASNKGSYVAGVFDVAAALNTGLYASKAKFSLFTQSWSNYIDHYRITDYDSRTIVTQMKNDIAARAQSYTFLHLYDPDKAGHDSGWMNTAYLNSVKAVDGYLGEVFTLIATNAAYTGKTAIVLTADHAGGESSGTGNGHGTYTLRYNYTVPFYVWGPGVKAGADLYNLNPGTRTNPGTGRPAYSAARQPIHNGEAPNLALDLLDLSAIPGSWLNAQQNLVVPEPTTMLLLGLGACVPLLRRRR
jgi:hypothetical protein